jgi:hypothetical protein
VDLTTIPITRGFLISCGRWFLELNGAKRMDHVDATQAPEVDSAVRAAFNIPDRDDGVAAAIQAEMNLGLWDLRLASVLNIMDIARAHGNHRDWTTEHAAQIRALMAIADEVVAGSDAGVVPQGFGAPVRTQMAAFVGRATARAQASRSAEGDAP